MKLKIWNTLGRQITEVTPSHADGVLRIYNCGPTVYSSPHIGNIRRFVVADLIVKSLRAFGYEVRSVMNITDVGHMVDTDHAEAGTDKMLLASQREHQSPAEIAAKYTQEFFMALELMRTAPADFYPRATMHIPMMIKVTEKLLDKRFAYETSSGIYFDVTKYKNYGILSGNKTAEVEPGARVDIREEKKNTFDFALWIKADQQHLMRWDSPWGSGYPGWHIECSAMAQQLLGDSIDVHTGGIDNMFPHHENEIAQSESSTGKEFSKIWVHNEHLLVDGKKMAKSDGTFITLNEVVSKGYQPLTLKFLFLQTHYRSKLNFTWQALDSAKEGLATLQDFVTKIRRQLISAPKTSDTASKIDVKFYREQFFNALANDLGTPQAIAVIFDLIRKTNPPLNEGNISKETLQSLLDLLISFNGVLSILSFDDKLPNNELSVDLQALLQQRKEARESKNFSLSDELRQTIINYGFDVKDTPQGQQLTPITKP